MINDHFQTSRRMMLQSAGCGFGALAASALASDQPHYAARASRVIFLFMHGGVSHVDTFDYKPQLQARDGERLPFAPARNLDPSATRQAKLMGSPWKFDQYGDSGLWASELFPNVHTEHGTSIAYDRLKETQSWTRDHPQCREWSDDRYLDSSLYHPQSLSLDELPRRTACQWSGLACCNSPRASTCYCLSITNHHSLS